MLKGTLDDFTMPDMFRLLSFTKKTGKLEVVRSAGDGKVFFRDGEVYYAVSSLKREPLGQKLIRSGALSESQLRKALDLNAATGERVGEILLRQETITEEQLINGVRGQIEDAASDLLRWETGDFVFESHERFNVEIPISVSVENLIMEASRRTDELETIRRKIPSNEVVLVVAAAPPEGAREINITPDEWRMLVLVDGVRNVGDIMEMAGADEFSGLRTLFGLLSSGLVDVDSLGPAPETAELPDLPEAARPNVVRGPSEASETPEEPVIEAETVLEAVLEESLPEEEQSSVEHEIDVTEIDVTEGVENAGEEAYEAFEPQPVVEAEEQFVAEESFEAVSSEADFGVPYEDELEPAADSEHQFDGEETFESIFEAQDEMAPPSAESESPLDEGEIGVAFDRFQPSLDAEEDSGSGSAEDLELNPRSAEYFDPDPADSFEFEPLASSEDVSSEDWFQAPDFASPEDVIDEGFEGAAEDESPNESPEPTPRVDRAAVVRELAGLFSDEVRPRRSKLSPESDDDADDDDDREPGDGRKRVEDDDQVNKKIINRLIDGVKGL